jgi:hypothetical protein
MSTRTMNIRPDVVRTEGNAWGDTAPSLVLEVHSNAEVTHRVRIPLSPQMIEEIAYRLWETRAKYAEALNSMTRVLKAE